MDGRREFYNTLWRESLLILGSSVILWEKGSSSCRLKNKL